MNKSIKLFIIVFLFLNSFASFAQSGFIKGNIQDAKTNEAIIGAVVSVKGTTLGTSADLEGNFELPKLSVGKYTISVSFIGYKVLTLQNVDVYPNQTTLLNLKIEQDTQVLEEVKVVGQRMTFSDVSVITEIKQAEVVAVGISAEQIGKTQDRDAAQVIRRVPGVTIYDDRFVNIRGLNERYNTVMLNDAISPSTEVDTRAFSFNLIPSGAIDRMIVYKSPSADLPADFSGGVIKVYTKTVPDGNKFQVGFQTNYRSGTTFQTVTDYAGGSLDWLGFDDGTRKLVSSFPSQRQIVSSPTSKENITAFQGLSDYYNPIQKTLLPDIRANVLYTKKIRLSFADFTNYTSLNYSNTQNAYMNQPIVFKRYENDVFAENLPNDFSDKVYQNNVRIGLMSNFALLINNKNKIEFRNLFNQLSTKETTSRGGATDNVYALAGNSFRFDSRSIYSGQLSGTHDLSERKEINWNVGVGITNRVEPDTRRFVQSKVNATDEFQLNVPTQSSPTLEQSSRFFSTLNEYVGMASGYFENKLGENLENPIKIKTGFYAELKSRDFQARWFGYVNPFRVSTNVSPDVFFAPARITSEGTYLNEGTNYDDQYSAQNINTAAYFTTTIPYKNFKLTAGARGEYNIQSLDSYKRGSGRPVNVELTKFNVLPSTNLSYNFSDKSLLRGAWGITLNRPEFRELAPFTYYDFNLNASKTGNPNLINATVNNFDLRYELYPSKSELFSVGIFYKSFKNPIEQVIRYSGSGVNFSYANVDVANSKGVELEVRKNFDNVFENAILKRFNLLVNASLIQSSVKSTTGTSSFGERQLQGQSPYIVNTALFYNDTKHGFQVNVIYNLIGSRIVYVGDKNADNPNGLYPDQYELPRNMLDFSISKTLSDKIDLKAGVQDVLNNPYRIYQDTNLNGKINRNLIKGQDDLIQSYKVGAYYSLGLTIKL